MVKWCESDEESQPVKALVTGATGFTGYNLTKKLLKKGLKVKVLVRDPRRLKLDGALQPEIVEGDIRDREAVKKAIFGVDRVFHIAAMYRTAGAADNVYYDIHVKGTRNLLEAAMEQGVKRFIHCSTVGVHGDVEGETANEEASYKPGDVYQRTKLEGELLARDFADKNNLALTVIRPTAIYGPGDLRLLKLFKLAARRITPVLGDGSIHYHMVYIDDLVDSFIMASEVEEAVGEVFIIGGNEKVTLNSLIEKIRIALERSGFSVHLPAYPFQLLGTVCEKVCRPFGIEPPIYRRRVDFFTKSRSFDVAKAEKIMGFTSKISLDEGIAKTTHWYKKNGYL
jgi:nucleoside-diphosphate-sugar epimerase